MTAANPTTTPAEPLTVTAASGADLSLINGVIESAVSSWPLPARLKNLALPLLRYDAIDAADFEFLLARSGTTLAGVAAWDRSVIFASGTGPHSILLHGLYVAAACQSQGVGRRLQASVFERASAAGAAGVIVKAERVAAGYFDRCGYEKVDSSVYGFSYPYCYWRPLEERTRIALENTGP